jgi:N-acetylglucosamine kinase-like BadF-type ATPase
MAAKITERRAARAARQLLYHRRLSEWIFRKTVENVATLENYLICSAEDRVVLLGGYVLERAGEDQESPAEVTEPIVGQEYKQMDLLEAFECVEVS